MLMKHSGKLFPVLVAAAVAAGLSIGFFLPGSETTSPRAVEVDAQSRTVAFKPPQAPPTFEATTQTFALSRLDVQDRHQAAELATDGQRHVWAVWESRITATERALFVAVSNDNGQSFAEPTRIRTTQIFEWEASGREKSSRRSSRMWPHVRYAANRLILNWVESGAQDPSQQVVMCAESTDQGRTFTEPRRLSTRDAVRPTFVGFAADNAGRMAVSWLDHRHGVQQPFAALSTLDAPEIEEQLVYPGPDDAGVCPCCNLDIEVLPDGGTLVAFRNNVNGFRDMWIAVRGKNDSQFASPIPVVDPRWEFQGCPHDGPSMAIAGNRLHLVWMDAHTGIQQVYYASANIGEWKFDAKHIHAAPFAQGHPSISTQEDTLYIVWDEAGTAMAQHHGHGETESLGTNSKIRIVASTDLGKSFSTPVDVSQTSTEFCSRPTMLPCGDQLLIAWTSLSDQGKRMVLQTQSALQGVTDTQVATHER